MKFGLNQEQYKILYDLVIEPLHSSGAKVYVFGSRARGKHHSFSDIDLLYVEDPQKPIGLSKISEIKENIENSNLTIKVDLVCDSSLANSYKESVDRDKVLVR